MNVLEQRYMTIMASYLPKIVTNVEKLNDNIERLIKLLENEGDKPKC